ncbi:MULTISPECIES: hypothetical protein [Brucella]|uniref:glutamine amidotransferase-related protein n=1 Tax=Brucella TaxID=234 RepID=UPI001FFFFF84|nr:hypothetical protein [Brucella intermedia]
MLTAADYRIHYYDLGVHDLWTLDPPLADLLVVLGGPVGVYETDAYLFLAEERQILEARLKVDHPTLSICLGAQQIAATLGATVAPSGIKENRLFGADLDRCRAGWAAQASGRRLRAALARRRLPNPLRRRESRDDGALRDAGLRARPERPRPPVSP